VKFTINLPGMTLFQGLGGQPRWAADITSEQIVAIARRADELGYDYLPLAWHLVMRLGEPVRNFGPRWPHSLSAAGFLLGATRRLTVMPLVVVPCHQPIELAKAIATLDWISGGRVVPVLMTGYLEWEFELLGVPFAERGPMMDEYVEALVELWSSDEPEFHGRYVDFEGIAFEPRPVQRPLPLWFGGRAKPALQRIARHGDGWMSYATPHARMREAIAWIRSRPEFLARPRELGVSAYFVEATHDPVSHEDRGGHRVIAGNEAIVEQLRHLASIGVDTTYAPLEARAGHGTAASIRSVSEYLERLEWFAEEIMPVARAIEPTRDGPPAETSAG
jgi:probable F420-dependent oxidoreductase